MEHGVTCKLRWRSNTELYQTQSERPGWNATALHQTPRPCQCSSSDLGEFWPFTEVTQIFSLSLCGKLRNVHSGFVNWALAINRCYPEISRFLRVWWIWKHQRARQGREKSSINHRNPMVLYYQTAVILWPKFSWWNSLHGTVQQNFKSHNFCSNV